jgi:hypothetical protein
LGKPVKTYLITTGRLFGMIAVMRLLRSIEERPLLATHPRYFLGSSALAVVAAAVSVRAWRVLRLQVQT